MSIGYCQDCDKRLDTDFIEYQDNGELLCANCLDARENENMKDTPEIRNAGNKLEQCRIMIEQCGKYYELTKDDIYLRIAKDLELEVIYWQAVQGGHSHESASAMAYALPVAHYGKEG